MVRVQRGLATAARGLRQHGKSHGMPFAPRTPQPAFISCLERDDPVFGHTCRGFAATTDIDDPPGPDCTFSKGLYLTS